MEFLTGTGCDQHLLSSGEERVHVFRWRGWGVVAYPDWCSDRRGGILVLPGDADTRRAEQTSTTILQDEA